MQHPEGFGAPHIHYHHHHHHHHRQQQQRQQLEEEEEGDDCFCSSPPPSVHFPISNPQNFSHPYQLHFPVPPPQKQPQDMFLGQQQQPIPIPKPMTNQLFMPQQQLFRPPFQHQQAHPSFFNVNFKLGLHGNIGSSKEEGGSCLNQKEATASFHQSDEHNSSHQHYGSLVMPRSWHPQEDSTTIKEPFWKQLSRCCNKEQLSGNEGQEIEGNKSKYSRPFEQQHIGDDGDENSGQRFKNLEDKCRFFGELEALYSLAKMGETNQTAGSGSALTGENSPRNAVAGISMPSGTVCVGQTQNVGANNAIGNTAVFGVDHGSDENSIGEEALLRKSLNKKRKRKLKEKLNSITMFFENLVKQVMDHQEMLHRRFLELIERMDKERTEKEEAWRKQQVALYNRETMARAHEQALASSREAEIVSYIEKITGQSIQLSAKKTQLLLRPDLSEGPNKELTPTKGESHSRWPKVEVEALIQIRSNIERKFREPGLKGPLWEEVSRSMASLGYQRSARRCKEKWENMNKYFRKARESTKKRPEQSKTCSYFNQLDQLYSRTLVNSFSNLSSSRTPETLRSNDAGIEKQGCSSELLEAFIDGRSLTTAANSSPDENTVTAGIGYSSFDANVDRGSLEQVKESKKLGQDQESDHGGIDVGNGSEIRN